MDLGTASAAGTASASGDLGGLHVHLDGSTTGLATPAAGPLVLRGGLIGRSPGAADLAAQLGGSLQLASTASGSAAAAASGPGGLTHVGPLSGHSDGNASAAATQLNRRIALQGSTSGSSAASAVQLTIMPPASIIQFWGHSGATRDLGSGESDGAAQAAGSITIRGVPNLALSGSA